MDRELFRFSPRAMLEIFEDGALVLRLKDRRLFELNATARDILLRSDGHNNIAQIATALAEKYRISETEARQDVVELYRQLAIQRLVEPVESS